MYAGKTSHKCFVYGELFDSKHEGRFYPSFKNNNIPFKRQIFICEKWHTNYRADYGFWAYDLQTQKNIFVLFEPKGFVDISDKMKFETCYFNKYTNIFINSLYLKNTHKNPTKNIIEIFNLARESSFKPFPTCNGFDGGLFPWRLDAIQRKGFRFLITNGEIYILVGKNFDFYDKNFKDFIIPTNEFYSQYMDAKFDRDNVLIEKSITDGILKREQWLKQELSFYTMSAWDYKEAEKIRNDVKEKIYKSPLGARVFWYEKAGLLKSNFELGVPYYATN